MGLFDFKSKKSRIGIDIGTASIKIVELEKESNRFRMVNYGIFELGAGDQAVSVTGQVGREKIAQLSNEEVVWGITKVLQTAGITTKNAIASIPSFPTFATTITLPFLSEEELAKTIPFEARKYVPIPLSEVQLDWSVIKVNKEAAQPSVEVFLVAVPTVEVVRYQDIMKQAGLTLRALELETFALSRALVGNDLNPIAVINVGGRSTSILIVENGYQRVSRDYEIGGFEITKAIARALNISIERAEELKRSMGIENADTNIIRDAMSTLVDMMALEANKTIHNYEETSKTQVANILLVGGLANMPSFIPYFSEKLGRNVSAGNALARVVVPDYLENKKQTLGLTFAVATGLAMREF